MSPCLFNFYADYITRNAGLDEAQAEIKIARRNINNLRYADDTTFMTESEEELKSLLIKVKEESEKPGLKLNIQKTKIVASGPITSWEIDGETVETMSDFILGGSKITADGDFSHEMKRCLLLGRKVMTNLDSIFRKRDSNPYSKHLNKYAQNYRDVKERTALKKKNLCISPFSGAVFCLDQDQILSIYMPRIENHL